MAPIPLPIPIPGPIPVPTADELWGLHLMPPKLDVTVLMPNGLIMEFDCSRDSSLESIKTNLWIEAKNNELYSSLNEQISYIFVAVTQDAKLEEFYDESRKLCDLRLFQPILKLIEPEGNREEKILSSEISLAIGRPIHEFDTIKLLEVIEFRKNILTFCRDICEKRERSTIDQRVMYTFPPELDNPIFDNECNQSIDICCWTSSNDNNKLNHLIKVYLYNTTIDVTYKTLILISKHSSNTSKYVEQQKFANENKDKYFLKICGLQQYLLGCYPLYRYKYIRSCLSQSKTPHLLLVRKQDVYDVIENCVFLQPSFLRRISKQSSSAGNQSSISTTNQSMLLWKAESNFCIKILLATYVNIKDVDQIYVKSGIYHGPESLCEERRTKYVVPQNPKWNEQLEFDLYIPDIPRNARLCFSICAMNCRKKREEHFAIAWGNMQLFDFKNFLLSERININLWPMPKGFDEYLNPLGMIGSNPNNDASCLQIEFDRFAAPVLFPSDEQIEEYADFIRTHEIESQSNSRYQCVDNTVSESDLTQIKEILKRDPLYELSEQDKELLWSSRWQLLDIPDSLPKLLDSVKWNNRDYVSQLYVLLKRWSKIKVETALELLDCKYADMTVRYYSVRWLDQELSDDLLLQYLIQLVQVLKKEPYFDNELTYFLLRRALMNQRIGHFFFWYLKAEMHEPINSLRCGLILEAYCRAVPLSNLKALVKQVGALEKLERLTDILKERKDDTQKDRMRFLSDHIRQPDFFEALKDLPNPLNSSLILGNIKVEECRIMDSAKRPLWLVWSNPDPDAQFLSLTNSIIFKSGDDLRQDMLTLQVIRIIDLIWSQSKLDLKMLPYTCLATGKLVGLIEVVRNSKTVMNIQRTGGQMARFQVDSSQLHKWIKENNKDNYDQAVENFTRSCAGYCVATFILGIGDRNPDNIMINEEGQIFHIDFGHFLGHFKKKFGINRERVPFVLTPDFLLVISKGAENPLKSKEFEEFQKLCGRAYLALHHNANLLITLFTMMLSTGIPELQSMEDISYLRQTLQVEKSSDEALKYFETRLDEAHGGAWFTKIDWFFHSVKHSSKT